MEFSEITYAIAFAAAMAGIGFALDKLTLPHQAEKLQSKLLAFWVMISEVRFANLHEQASSAFLYSEKVLLGKSFSKMWLFRIVFISVTFSCAAILFGRSTGNYLITACAYGFDKSASFSWSIGEAIEYVSKNFNYLYVLLINAVFDVATITVTHVILQKVVTARSSLRQTTLLVSDLLFAFMLFYFCYYVLNNLDLYVSNRENISLGNVARDIFYFSDRGCTYFYFVLPVVLFSATVIIPTIVFLSTILFLLLSRFALLIGHSITMHFAELGATGDRTVFFYLGIFFGLMVVLLKLVKDSISIFIS